MFTLSAPAMQKQYNVNIGYLPFTIATTKLIRAIHDATNILVKIKCFLKHNVSLVLQSHSIKTSNITKNTLLGTLSHLTRTTFVLECFQGSQGRLSVMIYLQQLSEGKFPCFGNYCKTNFFKGNFLAIPYPPFLGVDTYFINIGPGIAHSKEGNKYPKGKF